MAYLTKGERRLLEKLEAGEELTYDKGAGWWIGNRRTSGELVWRLHMNIWVSIDNMCNHNDDYRIYHINQRGREALERDREEE